MNDVASAGPRFSEYDSLVSLLGDWEALAEQSQRAARRLQMHAPEVGALLTEVS
jgi:hypothetical protein